MYQVTKRDGTVVSFDMVKIASAIQKAFEATETPYTESVIDFLAIKVTSHFISKIKDGKIVTSKSDKKNHGFGITNIRNAAENCGGELSVSCEEKPFGFLFRAEVVI